MIKIHYFSDKVIIKRTCSALLNIKMSLIEACYSNRHGEGLFCLCSGSYCNKASFNNSHIEFYIFIFLLFFYWNIFINDYS